MKFRSQDDGRIQYRTLTARHLRFHVISPHTLSSIRHPPVSFFSFSFSLYPIFPVCFKISLDLMHVRNEPYTPILMLLMTMMMMILVSFVFPQIRTQTESTLGSLIN